jgi:hypothetical protein
VKPYSANQRYASERIDLCKPDIKSLLRIALEQEENMMFDPDFLEE